MTGSASSLNFPTTAGAFDTTHNGSGDVVVTKLNAAGSALDYSTYIGGTASDSGLAIAIDGTGRAYVTGSTGSTDFPTTPGAYDTSYNAAAGAANAFVTKLSPDGSALDYSTYLGGFNTSGFFDLGSGIAVDGTGAAYVTGDADSTNFPTTPGAFDTTQNGSVDAFVTKLNPAGSALDYSTFIGGTSFDSSTALAVDGSGNAYIAGYGTSADYPTTAGAFDTSYNSGWDAFVTKLNASGTSLSYSTYLGGATYDEARGITVDGADGAYVTGHTFSSGYPTTPGAFDTSYDNSVGGSDAFVTKLNASGGGLSYSTFLGGSGDDLGEGIAVDGSGRAYVTGYTEATNFPTVHATDSTYNGGSLRRLRHEAPHRGRGARLLDLPRRLHRRPRICDRCRRGDRHGVRRRANELLRLPDNRGSVRHQLQRRLRRVRDEAAPARLHPHQAGGPRGGPAEPSRLDRVRNRVDQRAAPAAPARHRAGRSRRLQSGTERGSRSRSRSTSARSWT